MAMTLFRQWFIEPTKDGLPEGWEEVSLGDIFDIGIGRTPPRKESQWFSVNQHDIRWISVKDLGSIDTYILNSSEFLKEEAVKEFNIPIIPDNTVVLSFKLTVGRIGITIGEMVSNEAIAHFKLKPDSKISSNYLYLFLKTLDFSAFGSTSSIAEAINTKIIKEIKILVPNDELITSFQSLINPVFQKIKLNTLEIQTLEKLRDPLLPKLMSGEVRVKVENNEIKG
jgi:type I restriction enzyme S subunit